MSNSSEVIELVRKIAKTWVLRGVCKLKRLIMNRKLENRINSRNWFVEKFREREREEY